MMSAWPTLSGTTIDVQRTPVYGTVVQAAASGAEVRYAKASSPRYQYHLIVSFLRASEMTALLSLFDTVKGQMDAFTYTDPYTSSSVNVRFAQDSLSFTRICTTLWSCEVDLISVI